MLLVDVWDQICTSVAEEYRMEILLNVKALRDDPPSRLADSAYRRLRHVSVIHRRLLGLSAADYRMWLVGCRRSGRPGSRL